MRAIPITEKQLVTELLLRNHDIFVVSELPKAGMAKLTPIQIELSDYRPIHIRPPHYSVQDKIDMKPVIDKLLRTGTIEPDDGPWASSMVMVRKPGKDIRPCVGYHRTLNPRTPSIHYPPPRIDDFLDWANGAIYIFIGDLCAGYHQRLVHINSRCFLAFLTPYGKYRYVGLPMGLKNSQAYFQQGMEELLQDLFWVIVCAYIDDLMIRSRTLQGYLIHLQVVFNRLREKCMFLKIGKCQILPEQVACLGYCIKPEGLTPDPTKINKIIEARDPTDKDEVLSFLGLTNFYRDFIQNYSQKMSPIISLLPKDVPFQWNDPQKTAFANIKKEITSPPILVPADFNKPFIVKVDASQYAVGATLAQLDEKGKERPIRFFSKTLLDAETRYASHEREAAAVIKAFKQFRSYLHNGHKVTVYTDNMAVKSLLHPNCQLEPSQKVLRWIAYMQEFDYEIIHRAGKKNLDNDALSRSPIACLVTTRAQMKKTTQKDSIPSIKPSNITSDSKDNQSSAQNPPKDNEIRKPISVPDISRSDPDISNNQNHPGNYQPNTSDSIHRNEDETVNPDAETPLFIPIDIKKMQREDEECFKYIKYLETKELPTDSFQATLIINSCNQFQLDEAGILYRLWWPQRPNVRQETRLQLVIPPALRSTILEHYHDSRLGGHMGFSKTYDRLLRNYYWTSIYKDVREYIKSCPDCQMSKPNTDTEMGLLHPIIPQRIMQQWCMDVHGPLPTTERGNKFIVLFVERFTGFPEGVATEHQQSHLIAELITKEIICRYGTFEELASDKANNLVRSELITKLLKEFKINSRHTSAYHPQANGQVERYFRTIDQILKKFVSNHQKDWDIHLPFALAAMRFSISEPRLESPAFLMYGRDPNLPIDLSLPLPRLQKEIHDGQHHAENLIRQTQMTARLVKENLIHSRMKAKETYDENHKPIDLKEGELVLLTKPESFTGKTNKLDYDWKGPYRVIQVNSMTNVTIQLLANPKKTELIHVSHIKRFIAPTDPSADTSVTQQDSYEVDYIIDDRIEEDGTTSYKVHWKGFTKRSDSWVQEEDLNSPALLKTYQTSKEDVLQTSQPADPSQENSSANKKKSTKKGKAKRKAKKPQDPRSQE